MIDSDFYRNKLVLEDHLINTNTYKKVDSNYDEITMNNTKDLIEKHRNCFTDNERTYMTNYEWSTS